MMAELQQARLDASDLCTVATSVTIAVAWWNPILGGSAVIAAVILCNGLAVGLIAIEAEIANTCSAI